MEDEMNPAIKGYITGITVTTLICVLVILTAPEPGSTADEAKRLCEATGGQLLVTEYNSKTGLTLNCFYPVEDVGITPEPDSISL
jgi:hypothetical protein